MPISVTTTQPNRTVGDAVEEEIHLADRPGGAAGLLAVEGEIVGVRTAILEVLAREDQHTARAAAGIVHPYAGLGVGQADHQADDIARCVELAALLAGGVGELLDEEFVGRAEEIGHLEILIGEAVAVEVGDQALPALVGDLALTDLALEIDVGEDAIEAGGVGALELAEGDVEAVADVGLELVAEVRPAGLFWDDEGPAGVEVGHRGVFAGLLRADAVTEEFGDQARVGGIEDVAGTLEEEHAEDEFFVFAGVHLAAQDVGGFVEVTLQLGEREAKHRLHRSSAIRTCFRCLLYAGLVERSNGMHDLFRAL